MAQVADDKAPLSPANDPVVAQPPAAIDPMDIPPWETVPETAHIQDTARVSTDSPQSVQQQQMPRRQTPAPAAESRPGPAQTPAPAQPVASVEPHPTDSPAVRSPGSTLVPDTDDPWSLLIDRMELRGPLRLVALNALFERDGAQITLRVKSLHKHLVSEHAKAQLLQRLTDCLAETIELEVLVDDAAGVDAQTPDEIAKELHDKRLQLAREVIHADDNVVFMQTRFAAELDQESINYR